MKSYLILIAVLALSSFMVLKSLDTARAEDSDDDTFACETIAKLCPDGSTVTPHGSKCVMPACPHGGDAQVKPPANDDDEDNTNDSGDCSGDNCSEKKTDEQND